jgi:hypothetical protein
VLEEASPRRRCHCCSSVAASLLQLCACNRAATERHLLLQEEMPLLQLCCSSVAASLLQLCACNRAATERHLLLQHIYRPFETASNQPRHLALGACVSVAALLQLCCSSASPPISRSMCLCCSSVAALLQLCCSSASPPISRSMCLCCSYVAALLQLCCSSVAAQPRLATYL